jgi:hypothetical protein
LVDRDLNIGGDDEAGAVLGELATELAEAARTASAGDPTYIPLE